MGQVLMAWHLKRDVPVVLKLMLQEVDRDDPNFQKFLKECMLTARIRHPNVVKVLDYGILLDGLKPYLVMEFVEGESMRKLIREARGHLPEHDVARIMVQVCEGLSVVHAKGIIHRDLKPENIMIRTGCWVDDSVKILDFGIAQLQRETELNKDRRVVGSLGYMSPERLCNGQVDTRTDIYSLGVIMYEALTGCAPFKGNTAVETMAMHVKAQHVPPSKIVQLVKPQVDDIIAKALAKDPSNRYQSVQEMKDDIIYMLI
jgi:eukaryotic-like serine/threonine-protein kinase